MQKHTEVRCLCSVQHTPLPVTHIIRAAVDLTIYLSGRDIVASWYDDKAQYTLFEIEYSRDGIYFLKAGSLEAMTCNEGKTGYLFIHNNAAQAETHLLYYRLRLIGKDGRATLTPVVTLPLNHSLK